MWWVVRDALFHQQVLWGPCSQHSPNPFSGKHCSNCIPVVLSPLSDFRWIDHPPGDCVLTFFQSPSCLRVFQAVTVLVLPSFLLLSVFLNFHCSVCIMMLAILLPESSSPGTPPHVFALELSRRPLPILESLLSTYPWECAGGWGFWSPLAQTFFSYC